MCKNMEPVADTPEGRPLKRSSGVTRSLRTLVVATRKTAESTGVIHGSICFG
jgi:hypothetical protein